MCWCCCCCRSCRSCWSPRSRWCHWPCGKLTSLSLSLQRRHCPPCTFQLRCQHPSPCMCPGKSLPFTPEHDSPLIGLVLTNPVPTASGPQGRERTTRPRRPCRFTRWPGPSRCVMQPRSAAFLAAARCCEPSCLASIFLPVSDMVFTLHSSLPVTVVSR